HAVTAEDQLAMQAALQPYVDSAISKTINVPETIRFAEFKDIYVLAHALGVKGCTVYRPDAVSGAVLTGPGGRDQTCEQC
ncbi:MAG: hypothetical protein K9L70_09105, partial [Thiohalocapsa sp.]|nr:hypothetical protein [Thiohalocapsa sp.]